MPFMLFRGGGLKVKSGDSFGTRKCMLARIHSSTRRRVRARWTSGAMPRSFRIVDRSGKNENQSDIKGSYTNPHTPNDTSSCLLAIV